MSKYDSGSAELSGCLGSAWSSPIPASSDYVDPTYHPNIYIYIYNINTVLYTQSLLPSHRPHIGFQKDEIQTIAPNVLIHLLNLFKSLIIARLIKTK